MKNSIQSFLGCNSKRTAFVWDCGVVDENNETVLITDGLCTIRYNKVEDGTYLFGGSVFRLSVFIKHQNKIKIPINWGSLSEMYSLTATINDEILYSIVEFQGFSDAHKNELVNNFDEETLNRILEIYR